MPRPLRQNAEPDEFDRAVAEGLKKLEQSKKEPAKIGIVVPDQEAIDFERFLFKTYVAAVLQPSNFSAAEVMDKSGQQLWQDKIDMESTLGNLPRIPLMPTNMTLISGTNESAQISGKFLDADVSGFTTPALPYKSGETPLNKDGVVVFPDKTGKTLTAVMVHSVSENLRKGAGLANGAAVTVAHDMARLHKLRLPQMLYRVNETVLDLQKQMNHGPQSVAVAAARLDMCKKNHGYHLEVAGAGNIHVFIIGNNSKVRSMPIQTVGETIKRKSSKHELERIVLAANEKMETKKKAAAKLATLDRGLSPSEQEKIIQRLSLRQNLPPDTISKSLFIGAGMKEEDFKPDSEIFDVESGEIVIMASDAFMSAWSTNEAYRDKALAKVIKGKSEEGKGLPVICRDLLKTARARQKDNVIDDESLSLIAFEVPAAK